jgi:hypothetical protein
MKMRGKHDMEKFQIIIRTFERIIMKKFFNWFLDYPPRILALAIIAILILCLCLEQYMLFAVIFFLIVLCGAAEMSGSSY